MIETDTRTRILDAAQDLIQRRGANGISYQQISEAVGIRKPSIHHHFATKEALIEALVERYDTYFLSLVDQILEQEGSAAGQLARYIGLFEATLRNSDGDKACLCGMLGAELASLGLESAAKVRYFYEENEKRLVTMLETGRKSKEFRFAGDPRATAALIVSLLEGALLVTRAQDGVKQFKRITQQLKVLLQA